MKTDVSKSRETGVLTADDATIRAEREDPVAEPFPATVAVNDLRDFEEDERKPILGRAKLEAFEDLRILDEEEGDGHESEGAMDEVAAAIFSQCITNVCGKRRAQKLGSPSE